MDINLSIWFLIKIAAVALGTYVLLPLVLVARDFLLWEIIDKYILNDKLRIKVLRYTDYVEVWNNKYAKSSTIKSDGENTQFYIDKKLVEEKEYSLFLKERDNMSRLIEEHSWYIQKRSNIVSWLLKHYKQESQNPIPDWLQQAQKKKESKTNDNS